MWPGAARRRIHGQRQATVHRSRTLLAQWAGVPDSVYSSTKGENDYNDDFRCRGLWVNYLLGGSERLPGQQGLGIPVDMALALHSDAGLLGGDSIVGTMGIYCTERKGKFADGRPRLMSRALTDSVVTSIVRDLQALHEPQWTRRKMRDRSYAEARMPQVPTALIELLSHQNPADMAYGLDPQFRFDASRAIYKGILGISNQAQGVNIPYSRCR